MLSGGETNPGLLLRLPCSPIAAIPQRQGLAVTSGRSGAEQSHFGRLDSGVARENQPKEGEKGREQSHAPFACHLFPNRKREAMTKVVDTIFKWLGFGDGWGRWESKCRLRVYKQPVEKKGHQSLTHVRTWPSLCARYMG